MRPILKRSGMAAALMVITLPLAAHHGNLAIFDVDRNITLQGVVTKFEWTNPHVYIQLETENDAEEGVVWIIQASSTGFLSKLGWSPRSLAPGDQVIVAAHPTKNSDRQTALADSVLKEDGTLLSIRGQSADRALASAELIVADPPTPIVANDLSGRWLTRWDSDVASQFNQPETSWVLTDKGIAGVESYDGSVNPAKDCIAEPVPHVMIWQNLTSIKIGREVTLIRRERSADRTVYMNTDSHDGAPYTILGHSIGWWEDDVLVVDTARFADHRRGNAWGLPSGQKKHLVERFELSPDRTSLNYTFRLEDPEYLAESVTGTLELIYRPDLPMVDEPCDPVSARRYLE